MWITKLEIDNVKGVKSQKLEFSKNINVLIGPNNSGKSTILKTILTLQVNELCSPSYIVQNIRKGSVNSSVRIHFDDIDLGLTKATGHLSSPQHENIVNFTNNNNHLIGYITPKEQRVSQGQFKPFDKIEPKHFIVPYFSKRKSTEFNERYGKVNASTVGCDLKELYSKLDRISNPTFPKYVEYNNYCKQIFGFPITCFLSENGKKAGIIVDEHNAIPLDEMGEGATNILGLLEALCMSDGKVFLIEEIENDIHPKALKKLLEIIIVKSETNQFIVSTHSNIVLKTLGSANCNIFSFNNHFESGVPTTDIKKIENTPNERLLVLNDLGYELSDMELEKGYLIFEESSAEKIVRDFIIPNYFPKLKGILKTIASNGTSDIEGRFIDLLRLFTYIHVTSPLRGKAWVIADGDDSGKEAINSLRNKFKSWDESHFINLKESQFELYYPPTFKEEYLSIKEGEDKRKIKKNILNRYITYLENNQDGITELPNLYREIFDLLKRIESSLSLATE